MFLDLKTWPCGKVNDDDLFVDALTTHSMQEDKENNNDTTSNNDNPIHNQSSISYLNACAQNKNETTNATKQASAHVMNKNQTTNQHSIMLKDRNNDNLIKK